MGLANTQIKTQTHTPINMHTYIQLSIPRHEDAVGAGGALNFLFTHERT